MGVEVAVGAAIASTVIGAASTGYSIHRGQMEKKAAKTQAREQAKRVAEQKEKALSERRSLIDGQREQLAGVIDGYNANPTGQTGISTLKRAKKTQEVLG